MSASRLRPVLIAALILAYALLEHYSNSASAPRPLGAILAIVPLVLALLLLALRAPRPWLTLALVTLGSVAVLLRFWPQIERDFARIYLLQQCGIYLTLAATFGRSLLPGHTPLCTRWAGMVHGALAADALHYTRAVTLAWTVFFTLIVAVSAALYVAAPRMVWSLFSNFLVLPLTVLLFAVEYALRRRQLPCMPRASLRDTLRVYLADTRGPRRL